MSDISIHFTWWELVIASPVLGWPGALAGAALGALLVKKRLLGAVIGAIAGNFLLFGARLLAM